MRSLPRVQSFDREVLDDVIAPICQPEDRNTAMGFDKILTCHFCTIDVHEGERITEFDIFGPSFRGVVRGESPVGVKCFRLTQICGPALGQGQFRILEPAAESVIFVVAANAKQIIILNYWFANILLP
jgi:hypothetical protein